MEQGRIPLTLRVGVTGHRDLRNEGDAAEGVKRILDRLRTTYLPDDRGATVVRLIAVSGLAEGADRVVARAVVNTTDGGLEASLPLHRERYLRDFDEQTSKDEFDELVAKAEHVRASAVDDETYRFAGVDVVDHCDVLIVIWDGVVKDNTGGTSAIVHYAADKPQIWIKTTEAYGDPAKRDVIRDPDDDWDGAEVMRLSRLTLDPEARANIDEFNGEEIDPEDFAAKLAKKRRDFAAGETPAHLRVEELIDWIAPVYARADVLAGVYQDRLNNSVLRLYVLATLAVGVVAGQVIFARQEPRWALVEIGLLVGAYMTYWRTRRRQAHDRWLEYRFLAERLRSAFFIALAGGSSPVVPDIGGAAGGAPESWIARAATEVWQSRPDVAVSDADVPALQKIFVTAWIDAQHEYHERTSGKLKERGELLERIPPALFIATIGLAAIHFAEHWMDHFFDRTLDLSYRFVGRSVALLSLVVPAIAAAVAAVAEQREYGRNADRYRRTAERLTTIKQQMLDAKNLDEVRAALEEMRSLMLEENNDWFGVMRFRDVRLG